MWVFDRYPKKKKNAGAQSCNLEWSGFSALGATWEESKVKYLYFIGFLRAPIIDVKWTDHVEGLGTPRGHEWREAPRRPPWEIWRSLQGHCPLSCLALAGCPAQKRANERLFSNGTNCDLEGEEWKLAAVFCPGEKEPSSSIVQPRKGQVPDEPADLPGGVAPVIALQKL